MDPSVLINEFHQAHLITDLSYNLRVRACHFPWGVFHVFLSVFPYHPFDLLVHFIIEVQLGHFDLLLRELAQLGYLSMEEDGLLVDMVDGEHLGVVLDNQL